MDSCSGFNFLLLSADVSEFRRAGSQDPESRLFLENLTNDKGYAGSPETRNPKRMFLGFVLW